MINTSSQRTKIFPPHCLTKFSQSSSLFFTASKVERQSLQSKS
jgi:hypothetical protein